MRLEIVVRMVQSENLEKKVIKAILGLGAQSELPEAGEVRLEHPEKMERMERMVKVVKKAKKVKSENLDPVEKKVTNQISAKMENLEFWAHQALEDRKEKKEKLDHLERTENQARLELEVKKAKPDQHLRKDKKEIAEVEEKEVIRESEEIWAVLERGAQLEKKATRVPKAMLENLVLLEFLV